MASASELIHMATTRRAAIARAPVSAHLPSESRAVMVQWMRQSPQYESAQAQPRARDHAPAEPPSTETYAAQTLNARATPIVPSMRTPPELPPKIPAAETKRKRHAYSAQSAPARVPPLPAPKHPSALNDIMRRMDKAKRPVIMKRAET